MQDNPNLIKDVIGFAFVHEGKFLIHARANHFCRVKENFKIFMISRIGAEKIVKI